MTPDWVVKKLNVIKYIFSCFAPSVVSFTLHSLTHALVAGKNLPPQHCRDSYRTGSCLVEDYAPLKRLATHSLRADCLDPSGW